MTTTEIIAELERLGNASTKKVLLNHGAQEPIYGVKVEDLKKIQKRIKKNQQLAIELYDTGISDAMYLAGLVANPSEFSKDQLQSWARRSTWHMIGEYTVAWVASESTFGQELALEWINSAEEKIASSGWSTLAGIVSITPDHQLDIELYKNLLTHVKTSIHQQKNRVRYTMNGFVIAAGSYVTELSSYALEVSEEIGKVSVNMGGTACKVPFAPDYIKKVEEKGNLGKKKKTVIC